MLRILSYVRMAGFSITLSSLLLAGCVGHVTILDKEKCIDEGSLGAHCAHEYTSATRDIGKEDWDNTRFGWFCMDVSDTAETKKESEELCSLKGVSCDYQAKQQIQAYFHHEVQFTKRMRAHAQGAHAALFGY